MKRDIYLVTGAAGFVGSHLVSHLKSKGIRVRAMVRKQEQADALAAQVDEVVIADLEDPASLAAAVKDCVGVYHIAAVFRQENISEDMFRAINALGVKHMIDAAAAAGVARFVHCSTNGVHSDIDAPPADETYPFNPGDLYQETKLEGEMLAMRAFEEGTIRGVILRPTMIYGPGDRRTLKLFRMIAKGHFFYVGKGDALTHWVDVRDLARAFHLAMEATDITAEAFLIGGRRYMPLIENAREIARQLEVPEPSLHLPVGPMMGLAYLTEIICKPLGIEPPLFRRRVAFFLKNRAYDISKARDILKFEPQQEFAGEVRDIIASYRLTNDLPQPKSQKSAA